MAAEAKNEDELTKIATFDDATAAMTKKLDRLWNVIGSIDPNKIATHAGDVYFFTGPEMKERMWRVESTLKLGRHKFNVARLADSAAVHRRLAEMRATEKDPVIIAAIEKADGLTLSDYRMVQ